VTIWAIKLGHAGKYGFIFIAIYDGFCFAICAGDVLLPDKFFWTTYHGGKIMLATMMTGDRPIVVLQDHRGYFA
jgi:hypothetical protein